ncbi:hypothetical protein LguiA_010569 [Lonicera macranthoides]
MAPISAPALHPAHPNGPMSFFAQSFTNAPAMPSFPIYMCMMAEADALLLLATLIATITLSVGFTLLGGYDDGNCGPLTLGSIFISKANAQAFNITNYIAIISPIYAIFLYPIAKVLNTQIHQLIIIVAGAMLLAFTTVV